MIIILRIFLSVSIWFFLRNFVHPKSEVRKRLTEGQTVQNPSNVKGQEIGNHRKEGPHEAEYKAHCFQSDLAGALMEIGSFLTACL